MGTINFARGCHKCSEGCKYCYMFRLFKQFGWGDANVVTIVANSTQEAIKKINKANKTHISWAAHENIHFINSISDTFIEDIPFEIIDNWVEAFGAFPTAQFLLLTKRAERMNEYFNILGRKCVDNIWLGVSVENDRHKDRIDYLRSIHAKVHFLSVEPCIADLGELDLTNIQWVIIGGESKTQQEVNEDHQPPRPMKKEWVDNVIEQCRKQQVAVFFKQWGGIGGDGAGGDLYEGKQIHEYPQYK